MGLLNTFFVGTDFDAKEYVHREHDMLADAWDSKGLMDLTLAELWAVLQGGREGETSVDEVLDFQDQFEAMREKDEEWIWKFPVDFTERLAALTDAEMENAAAEWVKFEEMNACEASDGVFVLTRLRRLAKVAKAEDANVYLWMCL